MSVSSPSQRQQQADATQAHIAQVAIAMFAEHGFTATSTRKVAEAAGVSEGLIFHHFGNKLGLLKGAARRAQVLSEHIVAAISAHPDAPVDVHLGQIARGFTDFLRADRLETRLFRVLLAESSTNVELYELQQERTGMVTRVLSDYLQRRVESGELRRDLSPEAAAQMLLGSFLWFFITHQHLSPEAWGPQSSAFADAVVDQWLRGARTSEAR